MRTKEVLAALLSLFCCSPLPAVVISEVMYHPQTDETHNEWVEIYNESASRVDMSRWQFTDGIHFSFPEGTVFAPRSYLVIARDPETVKQRYGIANVVGPCTGALNNASDHIILRDPAGGIMAEVDYEDSGKWPVAADGAGHSLSKFKMRGDPMDPDNWRASVLPGGTPGRENGFQDRIEGIILSRSGDRAGESGFPVVINEVNFHTSGTQFVELYNTGDAPVNIGTFCLSNDPDNLGLFRISTNTILAAHGCISFLRNQLGFAMNTGADRIFFSTPSPPIVLDARAVEAGPPQWSEGRWPDGAGEWFYMNPTTGTANVVSLTTSVVINEIMYHPPTRNAADEYVELYNAGPVTVNLRGWSFSRGISFDFPSTATIQSGQYLVIAKDRARLISRYGLSPTIVLGNFSGELSDAGEKIRLRDANMNVADEVTYAESGHWPEDADGYGSSLELMDPRQDNGNYQAWAPSNETAKAQWTYFTYSAVVGTRSSQELHELQFWLMGKGTALMDDIHLTRGTAEYMDNGSFELGMGNWLAMGDHVQSYATTTEAPHSGTRCLKIIATDGGDTGCNQIQQDAASYMTSGLTYTLSFWAKWQWGNRVLVTRCFDNQLAETHYLSVPQVTGTPGAQNSVYRPNLGPVFRDVVHSPVIPGPTSTVHVTARVSDPDAVAAVNLRYKADSDSAYASAAMWDDGLHGDGTARDGLYGGEIPARAAGQTVTFYLEAADGRGAVNRWPTDALRPALYRVENAPLTSEFPIYRIILTQTDANTLASRPHLSNEPLNCTFVFDEKDIYYSCRTRYIGSPWHRRSYASPGYTGYKVLFNADEKLHGVKNQARVDFNTGTGFYADRIGYTLQRWMSLPNCPLEYVFVRFNSTSHTNEQGRMVWEDTTPPGDLYLSQFYRGDGDGHLFEMDDRFEYTDNNDTIYQSFDAYNGTLEWWGWDQDIYRNNYEVRNHENEDDYTSVVALLFILNNTPDAQYEAVMARVINVEQWFRLFAVRACLSDWDFIAFERGKNCYLYWPPKTGRCDLLGWDSEWTFQTDRATMSIWSRFWNIRKFQMRPKHQHLYFCFLKEMLDKYFTHAALDPWIDYYYAHVGGQNPTQARSFIDQRRAYLLGQIPSSPIDIFTNGGNPITVADLTVTLEGTAPVQVRWVRVAGVIYELEWTAATWWRITLPVVPGTNTLVLEFLDYDKNPVGTDSIRVTSTASTGVKRWREYQR